MITQSRLCSDVRINAGWLHLTSVNWMKCKLYRRMRHSDIKLIYGKSLFSTQASRERRIFLYNLHLSHQTLINKANNSINIPLCFWLISLSVSVRIGLESMDVFPLWGLCSCFVTFAFASPVFVWDVSTSAGHACCSSASQDARVYLQNTVNQDKT